MVEVAKDNDQESQMTGDVIGQYQIVERKKWEQRYVYTTYSSVKLGYFPAVNFFTSVFIQPPPIHILQPRQNQYYFCWVQGY